MNDGDLIGCDDVNCGFSISMKPLSMNEAHFETLVVDGGIGASPDVLGPANALFDTDALDFERPVVADGGLILRRTVLLVGAPVALSPVDPPNDNWEREAIND